MQLLSSTHRKNLPKSHFHSSVSSSSYSEVIPPSKQEQYKWKRQKQEYRKNTRMTPSRSDLAQIGLKQRPIYQKQEPKGSQHLNIWFYPNNGKKQNKVSIATICYSTPDSKDKSYSRFQ